MGEFYDKSIVYDPHTTISDISSRFSSNSESIASELLENPEEILPQHYMYIVIWHVSDFQLHNGVLPVYRKNLKIFYTHLEGIYSWKMWDLIPLLYHVFFIAQEDDILHFIHVEVIRA